MDYEFKGTPGPWRWEINEKAKQIQLCGGKPKYDLKVVDFVRYGMGGAAPRFNVAHSPGLNIMHRAETLAKVVDGREHHSDWFKEIDHPDANLIASAPELLEAAIDFLQKVDTGNARLIDSYNRFKSAVQKALNQQQ